MDEDEELLQDEALKATDEKEHSEGSPATEVGTSPWKKIVRESLADS